MWSQYDENLTCNPFFKEVKENHADIIEECSVQNWIICVPRIGTIQALEISSDFILDHIIIFSKENNESQYYTLSKKLINIQNKQITTDLTNLNSNNNADILFEETFYLKNGSKFIVWCIDRPLFLNHTLCDSHSSKNLVTIHDCIDFLWCESLGHDILDLIKDLTQNFLTNYKLEIENLQTQKEIIGSLFSQCLQLCFKNKVLKEKCTLSSQFLDKLKIAVETYMQYCLGRKLMYSINTVTHQKDGFLNRIVRNCTDIQYQNLGIKDNFSDVILSAKSELNQINSYWTVVDKTECIKKTLNVIFESGKVIKTDYITSDDVLQILVFVIIKLNVNNWFSNLTYLREFELGTEKSDQNEYCVSTLEAALEFIISTSFWNIKNNPNKNLEPGYLAIDFIEDKILTGDSNFLSNLSLLSQNKTDLCHPLCVCKKCQNLIKQRNNSLFNTVIPFGEISENLLIFATCLDKCEVVDFLLKRNIDVNYSDCFGKTSLHYAASKGLQNVLLFLVNKRPKVNLRDNEKNTPLHLASVNGHENCVKALLYSSPDVELNLINSFGDTPLHLAVRWSYYEIAKILLENGASVSVKNKRNQTVFEVSPNYHITRLCEKYSMRQHRINSEPIEICDISLTPSVQDTCKSHGIRPKSTDQFKKIDLLLKSIENNDYPLTCFYLGYGNTTQPRENSTCHPLCICDKCKTEQSEENHQENTYTSINVNMCNAAGYTPLHTAAKYGRTEILRLLLDSGALPNVKTFKTLYTPLHIACIEERIQIVRELLKCGECKIDERDAKGNTPLYYASAKGNAKIVEILLTNGADCNKKNFSGNSALTESEQNMQYGIFKLFRNHVMNKEAQISFNCNPF